MKTIMVVAAVLDVERLTLYVEDGSTVVLEQGDPRVATVVADVVPKISRGETPVVVHLGADVADPYQAYEEGSSGLIKLFRIGKRALSRIFSGEKPKTSTYVTPVAVGTIPGTEVDSVSGSMFVEKDQFKSSYSALQPMVAEAPKLSQAVADIMAHATPVSSKEPTKLDLHEDPEDEETVVAVVGNEVVSGVENLKGQLGHALTGSRVGMDNFLKRVAAVASKRRHSVDDLMRFMKRGDLPVADDGSIVIYKVLRRASLMSNGDTPKYVDCHTRRVTQQVGSYVCMAETLVDHDRSQECSNGLHVARRAYVGGFNGDVVVLAKVAPEDVIAVPNYDANKMRVCGYHILFELSDDAFRKLRNNQPFTDTEEAQVLLGRALSGDHDAPIERVEITESHGGGVVITQLNKLNIATNNTIKGVRKAQALVEPEEKKKAAVVDPKAVSKAVEEVKAKAPSRKDQAITMLGTFYAAKSYAKRRNAAMALMDFKKASKVSWETLGVGSSSVESIMSALGKE